MKLSSAAFEPFDLEPEPTPAPPVKTSPSVVTNPTGKPGLKVTHPVIATSEPEPKPMNLADPMEPLSPFSPAQIAIRSMLGMS